jgi:hypothetical protein
MYDSWMKRVQHLTHEFRQVNARYIRN